MPLRLDSAARSFAKDFAALLDLKRELAADVDAAAGAILDDVKARGDAAVIDHTRRLDKLDLTAAKLRVTQAEIAAAKAQCAAETLKALSLAASRIEAYHRKQAPQDLDYTDPAGVRLGARWRPIDAVGIYVPGGAARRGARSGTAGWPPPAWIGPSGTPCGATRAHPAGTSTSPPGTWARRSPRASRSTLSSTPSCPRCRAWCRAPPT
ncbi:MAG: histidinol dehydrogenase [Stellaceae bacterium]